MAWWGRPVCHVAAGFTVGTTTAADAAQAPCHNRPLSRCGASSGGQSSRSLRAQHLLPCLVHARARPCSKSSCYRSAASAAMPHSCRGRNLPYAAAQLSLTNEMLDHSNGGRLHGLCGRRAFSAKRLPAAASHHGGRFDQQDHRLVHCDFQNLHTPAFPTHITHQSVRNNNCTYVRRGHAARAMATSLLVGAAPRR